MSDYTEKSGLYQVAGPLGLFLLLAACFVFAAGVLYAEPVIVDKHAASGLAAAETMSSGDVFLGLTGCAISGGILGGLILTVIFKKEVS